MKNLLLFLLISFCHNSYTQNLKDSLGRKQGHWIEKIKGKKTESHYKDGLLHGRQTIFQKRKNINQERNFKNGVLDSISREYVASSNQTIIEASFKGGLLHGYIKSYVSGNIYSEVLFENGTPNSDLNYYDSEGLLIMRDVLHPSKLFFYVKEAYYKGSIILRTFDYTDPLYPMQDESLVEDIDSKSFFSSDIIKWMKSKKSFKERRKMAEKLYNFKVECK